MQDFPRQEALGDWRDTGNSIQVSPEDLTVVPFRCARSTLLYPTNPQQDGKAYHISEFARYNHRLLDGRDPECRISRISNPGMSDTRRQEALDRFNSRHGADEPLRCQQGETLQYRMLSFTYVDQCGNLYRGVWTVSWTGDEEQSYLWAKGCAALRTSTYETEIQPTTPVEHSEFAFLAALLPGDTDRIAAGRQNALDRGFVLASDQLTFVRP